MQFIALACKSWRCINLFICQGSQSLQFLCFSLSIFGVINWNLVWMEILSFHGLHFDLNYKLNISLNYNWNISCTCIFCCRWLALPLLFGIFVYLIDIERMKFQIIQKCKQWGQSQSFNISIVPVSHQWM